MENISLQYPSWFILLCILLGLAYAAGLYYRDNKFTDKPRYILLLLSFLRFLAVAFISFFLLEPYIKIIKEETKKPILVIAQDASESVRIPYSMDSIQKINSEIREIGISLSDKYDVRNLHFGENIQTGSLDSFDQKSSNFSNIFKYISEQYQGQPTAAIILPSDGIINEGQNPLYISSAGNIPIYSIALGDTTKRADLSIKNIYHNKLAFLGDRIPIQFDLSSYGFNNRSVTVSIHRIDDNNANLISKKSIDINSDEFFKTDHFIVETKNTGTQHYRIRVQALKNELSYTNNTRDIFIDVIDSKVKISILANSPHPDLSSLKQTLESNKNYEVEIQITSISKSIENPDIVILHNLPSRNDGIKALLKLLKQRKIPHFFIVGSQTVLSEFNRSQDVLSISASVNSSNEAQGIVNPNFYSFTLDENTQNSLIQYPPLIVPFGTITENESSNTLLHQQIGRIKTKYPMLSFNDRDGLKTAVLLGEGIWKWRIFNFIKNDNYEDFDQLINKTIQYLAIKEDKRHWQVFPDKKVLKENEKVIFKANLYNDNFELVNQSEAKMVISNKSGENYDFIFSRKGDHYTLDAGYFPAGSYSYKASNLAKGKPTEFKGSFIIKALQLEQANLVARHDILYNLSAISGGALYFPNQIDLLTDHLEQEDHKAIIYSREQTNKLLDIKWLFFLILGLLALEWFFRRYNGSY